MTTKQSSVRVARLGLLFALAIALSFLESLVPLPIPGLRLGLSNIVVMYCLFLRGPGEGYLLCGLKAAFVLLTRGGIAALLSLCGGLVSVTVMILLRRLLRDERYTLSGVGGAVSHNMGQLALASLLLGSAAAVRPLVPILAVSGVAVGILTAALLRALIPALTKITATI